MSGLQVATFFDRAGRPRYTCVGVSLYDRRRLCDPETKNPNDLEPMVPWHTEVVPQADGRTAYFTLLPPESTSPEPAQCPQASGRRKSAAKE